MMRNNMGNIKSLNVKVVANKVKIIREGLLA